jgi:hypothetical protein
VRLRRLALALCLTASSGLLSLATFAQQPCAAPYYCPGLVNAVTDCGVPPRAPLVPVGTVPSAPTDVCKTLQGCIDANPGKHIFLPKTGSTPCTSGAGGGCVGTVDYYSSCTITLNGNGMWLSGETPSRWNGGPVELRFAQDILDRTGTLKRQPAIVIPPNCNSCRVSDLYLDGSGDPGIYLPGPPPQNCWNPGPSPAQDQALTTYDPPADSSMNLNYSGTGPDGLEVLSPAANVDRVTTNCFARNGFALIGDGSISGASADLSSMNDDAAYANRGFGMMFSGSDAHEGSSHRFFGLQNQLGAIFDVTDTGNTHYDPESEMDNNNAFKAVPNPYAYQGLTSPGGGTYTLNNESNNFLTNSWVNVYDSSGNTDATCRVSGWSSSVLSLYYCYPFGSYVIPTSGRVGLAGSADVYAAYANPNFPLTTMTSGAVHFQTGAYVGRQNLSGTPVGGNVWQHTGCELTSGPPNFGSGDVVFGPRACETNVNLAQGKPWVTWLGNEFLGGSSAGSGSWFFDVQADATNYLDIMEGGASGNPFDSGIGFVSNDSWYPGSGNYVCDITHSADDHLRISDDTPGGVTLVDFDNVNGTGNAVIRQAPAKGATITVGGGPGTVNLAGGTQFMDPTGGVAAGSVTTSGLASFFGGVCNGGIYTGSTKVACWITGTVDPTTDPTVSAMCSSSNNLASIYGHADTTGPPLYVCEDDQITGFRWVPATCTGSGVCWTVGSGLPAGTCNNGSVYTNSAATGATDAIYVCVSKTWLAI